MNRVPRTGLWDEDAVSSPSSCSTTGFRNAPLTRRSFGVGFEDGDETWFVSAKRQAASGSSLRQSGLRGALQEQLRSVLTGSDVIQTGIALVQ